MISKRFIGSMFGPESCSTEGRFTADMFWRNFVNSVFKVLIQNVICKLLIIYYKTKTWLSSGVCMWLSLLTYCLVFMLSWFCFEFIYPKGISEADNMPYGGKSALKQFSGSPPRGKPRESRKGPETEMAGEHPDGTPPRPQSSTPSGQEKSGPGSGVTAGTHKVCFSVFYTFTLCYLFNVHNTSQDSPPKKTKMTGQAPQPQIPAPGPSSVPSLGTRLPLDPSAHHFCFSIDLRSIANLDVTSPVNCFLRWVFNKTNFHPFLSELSSGNSSDWI